MPSRVLPTLRLAVLCSHIEYDGDGLPFSLQEPLHTVQPDPGRNFPIELPSMYLYAQVEDAIGTFRFRVVSRDETGIEVNQTPQTEVTFDAISNRVIPAELTFELTGFRFAQPGIYSFHLICNHASLSDPRTAEPNPLPAPRLHVFARELS